MIRELLRRLRPAPKVAVKSRPLPQSLDEIVADYADCWTEEAQNAIHQRVAAVAEREWATKVLAAFERFGVDAVLRLQLDANIEVHATQLELMRARAEFCTRTATETLSDALRVAGISEAEWLALLGFSLVDQPTRETKQ